MDVIKGTAILNQISPNYIDAEIPIAEQFHCTYVISCLLENTVLFSGYVLLLYPHIVK